MKIEIKKSCSEELKKLNISTWEKWECEPCTFDWEYDVEEIAYIFNGKVKIKTQWEQVEINPGDLVKFPKGLKCTWTGIEPISKVYTFN